ncbi:MAG: TolC family protein [Xylophilus ampelinus]
MTTKTSPSFLPRRRPAAAAALAAACAALLAGCAAPPAGDLAAPRLRVAAAWRDAGADVLRTAGVGPAPLATPADQAPDVRALPAAAVAVDWWRAFGDPALDALVARAQQYDNDLAATAIRVRRAQLNAGLAAVPLAPQFSGSAGASASRRLDGGPSSRAGTASLGASYEVDLWNRLGSARDAARWEALATVQDREAAAQALAGTTATLYWQVGYVNQRLALSAQSIAYAERTLALVRTQYDAGAVSGLELAEARQALAAQRAARTALEQQRVQALNALALLFDGRLSVGGQPVGAGAPGIPRTSAAADGADGAGTAAPPPSAGGPAAGGARSAAAPAVPAATPTAAADASADGGAFLDWREPAVLPAGALPPVEAGLPADLIARRPDVRAAELRLRGYLRDVDATRAAFYPALVLTGSLGNTSAALANLLQNPLGTLGASLTLPFLQAGQRTLQLRVSESVYQEAVAAFRQTVYQAFADVDDALSARRQFEDQAALLEASLAEARRAEQLYETRYRAGAVPLKSWLDAQEKRRSAETALADNRYNRLVNHATLFRSLGGATAS